MALPTGKRMAIVCGAFAADKRNVGKATIAEIAHQCRVGTHIIHTRHEEVVGRHLREEAAHAVACQTLAHLHRVTFVDKFKI